MKTLVILAVGIFSYFFKKPRKIKWALVGMGGYILGVILGASLVKLLTRSGMTDYFLHNPQYIVIIHTISGLAFAIGALYFFVDDPEEDLDIN